MPGNIRLPALALLLPLWLTVPGPAFSDGDTYSAYDTNTDGYLDKAEFEQFLEKRRIKPAYRHLWEFEKVDGDGNGLVSDQELVDTLRKEITLRQQHKRQ